MLKGGHDENRSLRQTSSRQRCAARHRRRRRWIRESDIGFETNEPDSYALEEALRLKEKHGGEVVAISMGPERAKQTIKEALAKGADRGIHVSDDQFYKLDPLGSAQRSIGRRTQRENFDLILTGLQSDDQGFGQTGVLLAELARTPARHHHHGDRSDQDENECVSSANSKRAGFNGSNCPLPAVLSIQSGINKPRYATLKGIMAAKKKEIATVTARIARRARCSPRSTWNASTSRTKTKKTEFITGQPKEIAAKLIEKLKHEARVL